MKKFLALLITAALVFAAVSCTGGNSGNSGNGGEKEPLEAPSAVAITDDGLIIWNEVENATSYVVVINGAEADEVNVPMYRVDSLVYDFTYAVYAKAEGYENSPLSETKTFKGLGEPGVSVTGPDTVKGGFTGTFTAAVAGTKDTAVVWSIVSGDEFATVSPDGVVTAKTVEDDVTVTVRAALASDSSVYGERTFTILSRKQLTQQMLDELGGYDTLEFVGWLDIDLYTLGGEPTFYRSETVTTGAAFNAEYWYATYQDAAGIPRDLYYKNVDGIANQVILSYMNTEEYIPYTDDENRLVTWEEAGYYNNYTGLTLADFTFNEDTWQYEYSGSDPTFMERAVSCAMPYSFAPVTFGLVLSKSGIDGITAASDVDYTVQSGYAAYQRLTMSINKGDEVVIPDFPTYNFLQGQEPLRDAIENMRSLSSYTVTFSNIMNSISGNSYSGYKEYVTEDVCHFEEVVFDGDFNYTPTGYTYGYKKTGDNGYNSYYYDGESAKYEASRHFTGDFAEAKASFAFAPEYFLTRYEDPDTGEYTYYAAEDMTGFVSTLYKGVGNDIALYGLFSYATALNGTSYPANVTVSPEGYITSASFYYTLSVMQGVILLEFGDFNTATLPEGTDVTFETREDPTEWSQLNTVYRGDDETEVSVSSVLDEYFGGKELPFFGSVLGDTFGFGIYPYLYNMRNNGRAKYALLLYYDVPLDDDYTINSSLRKVRELLVEAGFTLNQYGEYEKDGLCVLPYDSDLDFNIYVFLA